MKQKLFAINPKREQPLLQKYKHSEVSSSLKEGIDEYRKKRDIRSGFIALCFFLIVLAACGVVVFTVASFDGIEGISDEVALISVISSIGVLAISILFFVLLLKKDILKEIKTDVIAVEYIKEYGIPSKAQPVDVFVFKNALTMADKTVNNIGQMLCFCEGENVVFVSQSLTEDFGKIVVPKKEFVSACNQDKKIYFYMKKVLLAQHKNVAFCQSLLKEQKNMRTTDPHRVFVYHTKEMTCYYMKQTGVLQFASDSEYEIIVPSYETKKLAALFNPKLQNLDTL